VILVLQNLPFLKHGGASPEKAMLDSGIVGNGDRIPHRSDLAVGPGPAGIAISGDAAALVYHRRLCRCQLEVPCFADRVKAGRGVPM
jgi:hypothetical protein